MADPAIKVITGINKAELKELLNEFKKQEAEIINYHQFPLSDSKNQKTLILEALAELTKFQNKSLWQKENQNFVFLNFPCEPILIKEIIRKFKNRSLTFIFKEKLSERQKSYFPPETDFEDSFSSFDQNWLADYLEKEKLYFPPLVVEKLAEIFKNQPELLLQEIEKIKTYKEKGRIDFEEIKELIRQPLESQVFDILNSLIKGNFKKAYFLLKKEIEIQKNPRWLEETKKGKLKEIKKKFYYREIPFLKIIFEQFYLALVIKITKQKPEKIKHPYHYRKLQELSQMFSFEEFKTIFSIFADLDKKIKIGEISFEDIPSLLVKKFSNLKKSTFLISNPSKQFS